MRELPSGYARDQPVRESIQTLADRDVGQARELLSQISHPDEARQQAQKQIDQAEAMQAFFESSVSRRARKACLDKPLSLVRIRQKKACQARYGKRQLAERPDSLFDPIHASATLAK